ncbi:hypothetical protein HPB50_014930 [Hyalomma asiaticum]|uniref:Uncharacterized protein n=1 Tax=Hyalomma asiaticum TaxID=266040 RepID=A0ACB7S764_HYAAI|nr:hypothetical protein HPB50_014930 [Hyalomma asiaticum]
MGSESKHGVGKQLVSVNEAAAQICKHIPALLTRRDELFPLARQAVRDSGYPFSKGGVSGGPRRVGPEVLAGYRCGHFPVEGSSAAVAQLLQQQQGRSSAAGQQQQSRPSFKEYEGLPNVDLDRPFTLAELHAAVAKLTRNTSPGKDRMPPTAPPATQ